VYLLAFFVKFCDSMASQHIINTFKPQERAMTDNSFFQNWMKNMPSMPKGPMDMQSMMEQGRKTFQAITEAQQVCMESLQVIAQRQTEILSQIVQDQTEIAREIATEATPEQKIARGAELIRKSYEKTMDSAREVSDMMQKSTREAGDIINNRVTNALNEVKQTVRAKSDDGSDTQKPSGKNKAA
jgi:phasin family protein